MEWNRSGRRCKGSNGATKRNDDWTREELSILSATKYGGHVMLAIAVVRQWLKDGRPKHDTEAIKAWLSIIRDSLYDKNTGKAGTYKVLIEEATNEGN